MRYRLVFHLALGLCFTAHVLAQQLVIEGEVYDRNTLREVSGVNIYAKGTSIGTSSDRGGRYVLRVPRVTPEMVIVFQHIAYDTLEIGIDELKSILDIYLQPRVIPLREVEIEAVGKRPGIEKDLPQPMSIFESKEFEIRGYVDAGDLLRTDHSIQVEEELSGKKTLAIRAGNPDDVVVLYNGIKMNSTYNNVFDLSLISLEDIERFEVIKGSNTSLYGSEAFSGIINIVPKMEHNYNIKVQQRLGTYDSGNWGLHLYKPVKRLHGSYSYKRGGSRRRFLDDELLENVSLHHTANLIYYLPGEANSSEKNALSASVVRSTLDFKDHRDDETLSNFNQIVSLRYEGDVLGIEDIDFSVTNHGLYESQILSSRYGIIDRYFEDQAFHLNSAKRLRSDNSEFLMKYQLENATLDFTDERILTTQQSVGLESASLERQRHGFVLIGKFHTPGESEAIRVTDLDISFRHDRVIDKQQNAELRSAEEDSIPGVFNEHLWDENTFKLSTHFSGGREDLMFNSYMNYGTNVKFPSLFQQISSPQLLSSSSTRPDLSPEKNTSMEVGIEITADTRGLQNIYGFQISGSVFRNDYENKFRVSFPAGIPVAFYDNVVSAKLSGIETVSKMFLFQKKATLEVGFSRYFVSEKVAFPFKSDQKITSNLKIDHAGYSIQIHGFKEGEQVGWIRQPSGDFQEITLPVYTNLDLHLSKTFEWSKMKVFSNVSARNVLNRELVLQGIAIRDRRFYLTVGVQY